MNRTLTKYGVSVLTILLANLIGEIIMNKLFEFNNTSDYNAVLIRMFIITAVFIPTFTILEKYIQRFSRGYVNTSKRTTKSNTLGLVIGLMIGLLALTIAYGYVWYNLKFW